MLEDLIFTLLMLFICFTFLYILFSIYYLFSINNVKEKDMWNFYKNQLNNRKQKD